MDAIYLDNNATTRATEDVVAAMTRCQREQFGNPSSLHRVGQAARHAIETARQDVAALIGARPHDVVFTSGGTESDNLAILGTLAAYPTRRHIVTSAVEHVAVHSLCERLEKEGYRVTRVGVNAAGALNLDELESAIDEGTAIVSIMHANNETGVLFPIRRVAEIASARGAVLHVDAVQTIGRIAVDVAELGVNLLTASAHKMHGPKGAGALYVGRRTRLRSQLMGGHQERDIRPGTQNVAAIVGFGAAARGAHEWIADGSWDRVAALRDRFEGEICRRVPCARIIGDPAHRVPNTSNIAFESLEAEAILIALSEEGLCASSGSACSSGSLEPSHVLKAMGIDQRIAHGAIRFSLSVDTTDKEIDAALEIVPRVIGRLSATGH